MKSNSIINAVSYIPPLFFLPLVFGKNSEDGRFHANQSLVLMLTEILLFVLAAATGFITGEAVYITIAMNVFHGFCEMFCLVMTVLGMINAALGNSRPLPIIGQLRIIK